MESRKQQIIKYAVIGGATGFVFGGTVGYLISDARICSLVPGYFDQVLGQSAEQLNIKLTDVATAQTDIFKSKLNNAIDGIGYLFQEGSGMNTAMNAIKFMTDKIPSKNADLSIPVIGAFVTKTLSFTHPILTSVASTAFDVTIDVVKAGLVATCMETMNQYKIIPIVCLGSTLVGAGIGALTCLTRSSEATQKAAEKVSDQASIKQSFLLFSKKMENMKPASQPQPGLHRPKSFSL